MTANLAAVKHRFPRQPGKICFNHCRISPTYRPAAEREAAYALGLADGGTDFFLEQRSILPRLRAAAAQLLNGSTDDITFTKTSAEGLNAVAHGYRLKTGDEIISYCHEFPSNHHPWRVAAERAGATLKLLPNRNLLGAAFEGKIVGFAFEDLEALTTPQTRIVALSHVQFTSGFALELERVAEFCRSREIAFVLDAAQSLGAMPIDVSRLGLAAVVASGWKWLMGPVGSALLYTSPEFRSGLDIVYAGSMSVKHPGDFLDLSWDPLESGAKFEVSSVPMSLAASLGVCLDELFAKLPAAVIWQEILRLQDLLLATLDPELARPALFSPEHRSSILSLYPRRPADEVQRELARRNVVVSSRDCYLRIAPHFYNTDEEVRTVGRYLNEILSQS